MRHMTLWLLILSMGLSGCSWGKTTPKPGIARADAEALVSAYLQDRVDGRHSAALQRLVPEARSEGEPPGEWTQYHLVASTEVEDGWVIQTREYLSVASEPRSTVVTDYYLVVRVGDGLAIDRPQRRWTAQMAQPYRRVTIAAFPDPKRPQRGLVMMQDGQTVLAQMAPELPRTFRPHGAPADALFGVGDNGWGALALSPSGQQIAFVTRGTHAFFGLVDRSGQVTGLNLWFEGGAGELAWSHDGQYLAATNMSPRGIFVLQLWSMQQNGPVEVKGLPEGRDISRLQWQGGTLHLRAGADRWVVDPVSGQAVPTKS